jgi:four helix bundle protein
MEYRYRFENLEVWKESKHLAVEVYKILQTFPLEEKYGLIDQLRRASISVPSNIAEGTSRLSAKEQAHFISMAYGSLMEMYCQLQIAIDLNYGDISQIELLLKKIKHTSYLLNNYRQYLTKSTT